MNNQIEFSEKKEGLVSVVIPTYNRKATLERAILSVLSQTYIDWELIIVDDGSTDGTEELVEKYISERIHYIKSEVNQGVSKTRNIGIRHAKGEYVAFLDSDDEWVAEKLEKQLKTMQEKGTKVVYCRFSRQYGEEEIKIIPHMERTEKLEGDIFYELLLGNYIGTPTMLIDRDILEEVGGFNEELRNLEDYELILRIAKDFYIAFTEEILVHTYALNDSINVNLYYAFIAKKYLLELYQEEYQRLGVYELILSQMLELGELAKKIRISDKSPEK